MRQNGEEQFLWTRKILPNNLLESHDCIEEKEGANLLSLSHTHTLISYSLFLILMKKL